MALHFFKAAGGVGPIADDAGQSGASFFDDVTFNGTAGEVRNLGVYLRNADATKQYQQIILSMDDSDPVLDPTNFRMATSLAGLDTATPGAALLLPDIVAANPSPVEVPVFLRCTVGPGTAVGAYVGIKFVINAIELPA